MEAELLLQGIEWKQTIHHGRTGKKALEEEMKWQGK